MTMETVKTIEQHVGYITGNVYKTKHNRSIAELIPYYTQIGYVVLQQNDTIATLQYKQGDIKVLVKAI